MKLTIPLNILRAAALFCGRDDGREVLRHVHIECDPAAKTATVFASNGATMFIHDAARFVRHWPDVAESLPIAPAIIGRFAEFEEVDVARTDLNATIRANGHSSTWTLVSLPRAPKWRHLVADVPKTRGKVEKVALDSSRLAEIGRALEILESLQKLTIFLSESELGCTVIAPHGLPEVRWLLMPLDVARASYAPPTLLGFLEGGK
jgi:hypothetical protein